MAQSKFCIRSKGRLLDLTTPVVMAIANLTPDSFFAGSRYTDTNSVVDWAGRALEDGATILDLGAMSSRPGADNIPVQEELDRLLPSLSALRKAYPDTWISIDTWRGEVVNKSAEIGADIINDISAGAFDPSLWNEVARAQLPYVLMHMAGNPKTMHLNPVDENPVRELALFFHMKISQLETAGIHDIIIDPGFGFGKSLRANYELINKLDHFNFLDKPTLVGISRKSMIQKVTGTNVDESLNGTTALHLIALERGGKILRVHDVKAAVSCIALNKKLMETVV